MNKEEIIQKEKKKLPLLIRRLNNIMWIRYLLLVARFKEINNIFSILPIDVFKIIYFYKYRTINTEIIYASCNECYQIINDFNLVKSVPTPRYVFCECTEIDEDFANPTPCDICEKNASCPMHLYYFKINLNFLKN